MNNFWESKSHHFLDPDHFLSRHSHFDGSGSSQGNIECTLWSKNPDYPDNDDEADAVTSAADLVSGGPIKRLQRVCSLKENRSGKEG